ncbi:hypothetical protein Cni_G15681 [Canna indica]|uniref:protein-serine/threonine phosphatase n=1 Tax=Canna indica TaxID=4628 RepID=A0AAQ3QF03_9LILI|nr:hypothetical protein Cni_G15681 [Canna indica]
MYLVERIFHYDHPQQHSKPIHLITTINQAPKSLSPQIVKLPPPINRPPHRPVDKPTCPRFAITHASRDDADPSPLLHQPRHHQPKDLPFFVDSSVNTAYITGHIRLLLLRTFFSRTPSAGEVKNIDPPRTRVFPRRGNKEKGKVRSRHARHVLDKPRRAAGHASPEPGERERERERERESEEDYERGRVLKEAYLFCSQLVSEMAEICEASKVSSCEPGVRGAVAKEARRFRFAPAVAEDVSRKRQRLDRSGVCGENRGRRDHGAGEGSSSQKSVTLDSGPPREIEADGCPKYGLTSVCGRRREMEDAVSVRPDFVRLGHRHHFFGVYDGHGCSHVRRAFFGNHFFRFIFLVLTINRANWCGFAQVAESCRDRMHEMVAEEITTSKPGPDQEWTAVMERSFSRMDAAAAAGCSSGPVPAASCRCELQTPKCDHVGSTAVVAVVGPSHIVVANCGDSRAVLCRNGVAVPLSSDHKPDRPDELQRIEAAGGRVIYWDGARVLGVLAMSRAIGDSYLKPYVIAEPEVTVAERKEGDECLILGSDGLWDVVSNEMACEIARTCLRNSGGVAAAAAGEEEEEGCGGSDKACSDAAILLTKLALARHSTDNVSVVVVDLRRRA